MSFLVLLPVGGSRVQYVLSCENPKDQWLYLIRWLNEKSIAICSQSDYSNPNDLKPRQTYCVAKEGEVQGAYLLFQVLQTPDWESAEPAPNFTADVGSLVWVLVGKDSPEREKIISPDLMLPTI